MQLTPVRVVTAALALPVVLTTLTAFSALSSGCGQVTGLSNDYLFDLNEAGGSAGDASGDGASDAKSDAPADGTADGADAAKCSPAQATAAQTRMNGLGGTAACKSCLASSCCTDVETCSVMSTGPSACMHAFTCRLDCTTMGADRTTCLNDCANSGGTNSPIFTSTLGACSAASCKTECGF